MGRGKPPHRPLEAELEQHADTFRGHLSLLRDMGPDLRAIPREQAGNTEPFWANPNMSGLDGASVYYHLRRREPLSYLEIGSGNSTKLAARAKRDGALATRIVSIDPQPRLRGVDELCDERVRQPLEEADLSVVDDLHPGDVVFFDGSHRLFMNSDVAVFFLDAAPSHRRARRDPRHLPARRLPGGVGAQVLRSSTEERAHRDLHQVGPAPLSAYGNAFWLGVGA